MFLLQNPLKLFIAKSLACEERRRTLRVHQRNTTALSAKMGYSTRSKSTPPAAKEIEKAAPKTKGKAKAPAAEVENPAAKTVKADKAEKSAALESKAPKATKASAKAAEAPGVAEDLGVFPDVKVLTEVGTEIMSATIVAEKGAVVFVYPKANTPGCTKQACGFRDDYSKLEAAGFGVYGLSYDTPKSQNNWKARYDLPYGFLCDTVDGGLIKALGAQKAPKGIIRSHFVIAKGGKILDKHIKIAPGDSFAKAVEFVQGIGAAPSAPVAKADDKGADDKGADDKDAYNESKMDEDTKEADKEEPAAIEKIVDADEKGDVMDSGGEGTEKNEDAEKEDAEKEDGKVGDVGVEAPIGAEEAGEKKEVVAEVVAKKTDA
jgi:thioredoxin-dependent peroxiredoxin